MNMNKLLSKILCNICIVVYKDLEMINTGSEIFSHTHLYTIHPPPHVFIHQVYNCVPISCNGEAITLTGSLRDIIANSLTWLVIVAEKSIVWRVVAHCFIISLICSSKFSSNIRSASSKTRICKKNKMKFNYNSLPIITSNIDKIEVIIHFLVKKSLWFIFPFLLFCLFISTHSSTWLTSIFFMWKFGALRRWSISLPGVAMTMSGICLSACSWIWTSRPPTQRATVIEVNFDISLVTSNTWKKDGLHKYLYIFLVCLFVCFSHRSCFSDQSQWNTGWKFLHNNSSHNQSIRASTIDPIIQYKGTIFHQKSKLS